MEKAFSSPKTVDKCPGNAYNCIVFKRSVVAFPLSEARLPLRFIGFAPLAKLDIASVYGTEGQEFESLTVHQKCGQAIRPAAFFASSGRSHSCILRSSRAKAGTLLFFLPPPFLRRQCHRAPCAKIISYGAPKTGQPLGRPVFLFIDKQNRRSRSFDFSCLAEKSKSGVLVRLPEALLFIRSVFRMESPKFSHGSFRRADPAAGPQARRLRLHSPQDRCPASDRCRPALQTAPR